ncbi:Ubiquitin carboxyl-terminal hydrolase 45, partial [Ophiophagus hannah]
MRVKDPSKVTHDKNKRQKKANQHQDEDSSDDITGLTCQHVGQAVDVHHVKRAVAQNVWSICSECLKERRIYNGEPVMPSDIWLCLRCGIQGCGQNSEGQHSLKHFQTAQADSHCIVINLSTWIIWCYECNEELSTHCNKKALTQIVDFLQRHVTRNESSSSSKIIWLHEENNETNDILRGKGLSSSWASVSVKGINNLGNTCFFNAVMQDPLVVNLSNPGSLTSAMLLFLHSMKDAGKGPLSPKILFNQLCQKAPRFKGFQQQDSQEVLHYLLDAMRIEETKRIQAAILTAFNNPTSKTADEETKRKVKAYGREGVKMNFIDRIFVGELTSTIMCEECENTSKPVYFGRTSKGKQIQGADTDRFSCSSISALTNQQSKLSRKCSLTKDKNQVNHERRLASKSGEEETSPFILPGKIRNSTIEDRANTSCARDSGAILDSPGTGSQTEGSEKEVSRSESSIDADSEASESESASKQITANKTCPSPDLCTDGHRHLPPNTKTQYSKSNNSSMEALTSALSKFHFGSTAIESEGPLNTLSSMPKNTAFSTEMQNPQNAFQTLSQSYITSSKECSVQSCLYQFTSVELLMGNNKLLCENCTDQKHKRQKKANSTDKKTEGIYTNARKQLLISLVPAVLILHLKRFHQAGMSLRKVNRHVDFPLVLDLAPFCSAFCKHNGSMRGGLKETPGSAVGQWVYVSDTYVQAVPESRVLNSQAYLLFYERIL